MKKEYIAPCSNVINVQAQQHLLSASGTGGNRIDIDDNNDNELDAGASYSMKRDNIWDNQW